MENPIQSNIGADSTAHNVYYCQTISGIRRGSEPPAGSRFPDLCSEFPPMRPGASMRRVPGHILTFRKPRRSAHIQADIQGNRQHGAQGAHPCHAPVFGGQIWWNDQHQAAPLGRNQIPGGVLPCINRKIQRLIASMPARSLDSQLTFNRLESIQPIFFNLNVDRESTLSFERRGGVSMCQPASMPPRFAHPMDCKSRDECMARAGKCDGSEKGCWKW